MVTMFKNGLKLLNQRPQVLSLAAQILWGRLSHTWIRHDRDGYSPPPEHLTLMVTDACNLHCRMCQYSYTNEIAYQLRRTGGMPGEVFYKLMDEIPGRPFVSLTGGEPLLHPRLAEYIAYIKGKGRLCTLTTNGWMLAEKAEEICAAGVDLVVVSVDGPREIHDGIRGAKSFERLSKGLEAILRLPRRPVVFVSTAISNLNYATLPLAYELARQWGVDGMNVNHLWMQSDEAVSDFNQNFGDHFAADSVSWEVDPEKVDTDRLAKALAQVDTTNRGHMLFAKTPPLRHTELAAWYHMPNQPIRWKTTRCAWARLRVWPDGSIKPCRGWVIGNVKDKHVMDMWNEEKLRRFRRLLAKHGTLPICRRCCYIAYR